MLRSLYMLWFCIWLATVFFYLVPAPYPLQNLSYNPITDAVTGDIWVNGREWSSFVYRNRTLTIFGDYHHSFHGVVWVELDKYHLKMRELTNVFE